VCFLCSGCDCSYIMWYVFKLRGKAGIREVWGSTKGKVAKL